jgi:hypothetical protein
VRYLVHQRVLPALRVINEGNHMKTARYLAAAAVVAGALFSPLSFADNANVRFRMGDGSFAVAIGTPPPVRVVEYVPAAYPGRIWVPGYRAWNGHRHVWHSGAWERPQPHYREAAGHWERRHEQRDFVRQVRYEDRRDQSVFRGRDERREHSR